MPKRPSPTYPSDDDKYTPAPNIPATTIPSGSDEDNYTAASPTPANTTSESNDMMFVALDEGIQEIDKKYADSDGYIHENDVDDAIRDVLSYAESQMNDGNVTYYEQGIDSVYMELSDDTGYMYIPNILGCSTGGTEIQIVTFQPFYSEFSQKNDVSPYIDNVDDSALKVEAFSDIYSFLSDNSNTDHDFNDKEVSITVLENIFKENSIIIWHGHGSYSNKTGSILLTGIEPSKSFLLLHISDYFNKRFLYSSTGRVVVTAKFFEEYIDDGALAGSLIYLGGCSSGADSTLSDVFIDKGAQVVFAYSDTIYTWYDLTMMKSIFNAMTSNKEEPVSAADALAFAKKMLTDYDYWVDNNGVKWTHNTEVIFYGNGDYTLETKVNLDGLTLKGHYKYYGSSGSAVPFDIVFSQSGDSISGIIYENGNEVATFEGTYKFDSSGDAVHMTFIKTYNRISNSEQVRRPSENYDGWFSFSDNTITGVLNLIGQDGSGSFTIYLD